MSILSTLSTDTQIADEKDVLGGSGVLESGLYPATVTAAYITKANSEALGLNVILKIDKREHRETLWMTSGKAKGGKNYYERNGEKHYLPGFLTANSLSRLTVGKEINELDTEKKVIKKWDSSANAEVPGEVDMVQDLVGQEILVGLKRQTVDKTVKNQDGEYIPNGETRDENTIDKLFRSSDRKTVAEILAKQEATFADAWVEKWAGKTVNKAKGVGATGGTAGAPAKPKVSLFS